MVSFLICALKTGLPGVISAQPTVMSAWEVSNCDRFLVRRPILHFPRRRSIWVLSFRVSMSFLLANESSVVRYAAVLEKLDYVLQSMYDASASIAMDLTILSTFLLKEFSEGYTPPAENGCVSYQVQCPLAKKGLKISQFFSAVRCTFRRCQASAKYPAENMRL